MADDKVSTGGANPLSAGGPVPEQVPILPLRDTVLFPQSALPLGAGRESSVRLLEDVVRGGRLIGVFAQRDPATEDPQEADLHRTGTLATVHKVLKQPDGTVRLLVQGLHRIRIVEMTQVRPYLVARIAEAPEVSPPAGDLESEALARNAVTLFRQVVELSPMLSDELATVVQNVTQPDRLGDLIAATLPALTTQVKQELLETPDVKARLVRLVAVLTKEAEVLALGSKIQSQVESEVGRSQREYYLREQLKAIQKELGQTDERTQELDDLREKIEAAGMTEEAKKEALRELDRLSKMPPAAAEYTVARTYLDWLLALPWTKQTTDNLDIAEARRVLDEDHSGLEKVKERILEYLAVKSMRPTGKDPILCFVGPPGVGKTSLGRSIARALGRKFHRISLGGMRDEAEIRGHRRTYIGALPGQIIQGLRRAESKNAVFMLDEVDKLGMDFRGDPASALLEVLDPEQNVAFRDHYVDVAFDLSKILFITTANMLDTVPPPLRDRMEIIEIAGYTEEEKVRIARTHLVPKQVADHGLIEGEHIRWTDAALRLLVRGYTREAGLRNLEREIAAITRKVAKRRVEGRAESVEVTEALVGELLGAPRYLHEELEERTRIPGVAVGLSWTPTGGEILFIEATRMKGSKTLTLTGQLGDVMKESAQAALSWARSHVSQLGVRSDYWDTSDIHIHVPAGAIPKDGPSAGVTMVTALVSLMTQRPVRSDLAMTGEVTLSGRVLPVGGIKEKVLGARRADPGAGWHDLPSGGYPGSGAESGLRGADSEGQPHPGIVAPGQKLGCK
jgi:ATP-dependent Lon protease